MTQPFLFHENKKDYMLVYNHKIHALDLFNITDKKVEQITLEREGPNGITSPRSIAYFKGRFLVGTMSDKYYLVNRKGEVMSTHTLPSFSSIYAKEYNRMKSPGIIMNLFTFHAFNPESGEVAIVFYPTEMNESPVKRPYIIVVYSLETEKIEEIEIPYSKEFSSKTKWGILNDLNICFHQDLLILNNPASSNIYTYNRKTKEYMEHSVPSSYVDNKITLTERPSEEENAFPNKGFYYPVQYDSFRNIYWRVQAGPAERPTSFDRIFSISQISTDFNTHKEVKLPDEREETHSILLIGKDNLYLNYAFEMADEELWLFEIPLKSFDRNK
ncbi:hypothetical protein M2137_002232 [Parabacteroides sp. PFB2-10]|uniref:DUF4221 family protein n=1 Tax=Parabacteroides sp. PFB2-10 TaxID=1742405 RepID=UPI002473B142|nr:DUF4221 family protein [Parabacteroides sp. PFB2-10]MDH6313442.1 hypothetical protein [Parabacteroides sp. PFB2-10]